MYSTLIFTHSLARWFVVVSLLYTIIRGLRGWSSRSAFSKTDNLARHLTATIAHIQLMIGWVLYFNSPFIAYFRTHFKEAVGQRDLLFFGMIHITLMTIAIIVITIGSSSAKRQETDIAKFRIMTIFYTVAFVIIFIAVPWPFSPFSARNYLPTF
nr:hypothetical protein [uncultured Dyadobacter sp.]